MVTCKRGLWGWRGDLGLDLQDVETVLSRVYKGSLFTADIGSAPYTLNPKP